MKTEKFKVIQSIREFIIKVDKELENFPKKDLDMKKIIVKESYEILEIAYEANTTDDLIKRKALLCTIISKIKTMDFILNLSYEKQLISPKKYTKLGLKMDDIIKYITGWMNKTLYDINH